MKGHGCRSQAGFTLVELLVAIPVGLVIMAGIYRTFKVQQDSYIVQDQVAAMHQNLRGALHIVTRDLLMAGFLTALDKHSHSLNWDDRGGMESKRALIVAGDNVDSVGDGIRDGTDVIVIVKASDEGRPLGVGESATGNHITLVAMDVDLDTTGKRFGILVTQDLRKADFFEVHSIGGNTITTTAGLSNNYGVDDLILRVDIVIYKIDDSARPCLRRKNLGQDNGYQVVAQNIENMQFRYLLSNGAWTDDPAGVESTVRAVQVFLVGRSATPQAGYRDTETYTFANNPLTNPNDAYRRRMLSSIVKTRNLEL
jgi:type IV pilus assembly protein PilW